MENKTKRLVFRSNVMQAVQWNDAENPPIGVKGFRDEEMVWGEFYSNNQWQRLYLNDWVVYVHEIGRYSPVMKVFDSNQLAKEYIEVV